MPRRGGSPVDLGFRDMTARVGDHIAYFWETNEEFDEAVGFLRAGIAHADHLVIFGHDEATARICETLEAQGEGRDALQSKNRLSVLGPETTDEYLARFDGRGGHSRN